ncbi:MAG: winged helix-turn-helix transcriptional regulator [Nitrososphaerota archaeon]|nr:winged helix-turn-helix transcriptional regulator [Nitrososphaerota archaeon]MDG6922118.1 winged helix-turn-helix transcriptional regulator [Nitrososphaerota archaeon]
MKEEGPDFAENTTTKNQMLEYIRNHPGSHLRQIKRELNISMGVVQYHLNSLERERKIIARRKGLYKRFYLSLAFGEHQQEILDVLSQETERDLLLYLIKSNNATQKQVSEYSKISAGTINWHMKRLQQSGLVSIKREGQFVRYNISVNSDEVMNLLQSYHPSIWETWADRFANAIGEVASNERFEEEEEDG